jgi:hypothetical protein
MTTISGLPPGVYILWCGRRPVPVSMPPEKIPTADKLNICAGRARFNVSVDTDGSFLNELRNNALSDEKATDKQNLPPMDFDASSQFEELEDGTFCLKEGLSRINIVFADK